MVDEKKKVYLSPPHMGDKEQEYIKEAFQSNWVAPLGPHVDAFESELCAYVGASSALALNSGTSALHLAMRLLNIEKGDTIFCSTLTFVASVNPVLYEGGTPVFIDSEPETWNMSPTALERALHDAMKAGKLPKAVIVVNLYGQSADMDAIINLCSHYNVPIVEDAAESLGATYRNAMSGTLGRFGIYSFNGNKIITTSGGGMLVSNDQEAIDKARFWATQAREKTDHYEHREVGHNYRLSNILAGIGRAQLSVLEDRIAARRRVNERYRQDLGGIDGVTFMPEAEYGRSTTWLSALTIDPTRSDVTVDECIAALAKENIESRRVWKPMHLQPLFADCAYYPHAEDQSVAEYLFQHGLCLPSGSSLSRADQSQVVDIMVRTLKGKVISL